MAGTSRTANDEDGAKNVRHRSLVVTHDGIAVGVGRAFSRVCLSICLFVLALTGKRLELSTPNLVHMYSRGQKVKGHTVRKPSLAQRLSRNPVLCYLQPLPAWVCMSIRLPMFSSPICVEGR